jgi:hypothetical protein
MTHAILRGAAIATVLCLYGCSGASSNQSPPGDSNSPEPVDSAAAATVDSETPESNVEPGAAAVADTAAQNSDSCGGRKCEEGQSCIEYYGFAGNRLYTCGIPCKEGEANDGCPEDMKCQVAPDGPTQCVNR